MSKKYEIWDDGPKPVTAEDWVKLLNHQNDKLQARVKELEGALEKLCNLLRAQHGYRQDAIDNYLGLEKNRRVRT